MTKINRVVQEVLNRAAESVPVKELKGNFLGQVKATDANSAIKEAVTETTERIGAELQAVYNKPFVTRLPGGGETRTYTEFGGVRSETYMPDAISGKHYMSHYERTTTKGRYEIDLNPDGTYKSSTITTPKGSKTRPYVNGRFEAPKTTRDWLDLEKAHEANKGRIVKHGESSGYESYGSGGVKFNYISNEFADGSTEFIKTTTAGEVLSKNITFPNGDMAEKDIKNGVTYFSRKLKPKPGRIADSYVPVTIHKDSITGDTSSAIVRKNIDEFGRDVREVEMDFANYTGIKADKFVYILEKDGGPYANRVKGKLISGSFDISGQAGDIKKVVYKDGKLIVDGKELDGTALRELGYRADGTTSELYGFELLFQKALEHARISPNFNPSKYSHTWKNM